MAGVTNGSPVNASNTNSAYIIKNADDQTPSKLGLVNTDTESGPTFTNAQKEINNKTYAPVNLTISGGGIITIIDQLVLQTKRVTSNGGAVTVLSTPFGTSSTQWVDGMEVRVMGESDTDSVKIEFSDEDHGAIINGPITLNEGIVITLQWHATKVRWIEVSRNN